MLYTMSRSGRPIGALGWFGAFSPVISPTKPDVFDRIVRAALEGAKPICATAFLTAWRVVAPLQDRRSTHG